MRTTVDIDKEVLEEALKISKIRTKKELINISLKEYIRRMRLKNLIYNRAPAIKSPAKLNTSHLST